MAKAETVIPVILLTCFLFAASSFIGLWWYQAAVGDVRKGETQNGYWGPVASSVDWCEENYLWVRELPMVAEFHNSFTSFIIVFAGWIVVWSAWKVKAEWRFHGLGHTLAIVGLGSVAFHGALQRGMQAADEVPMCWVAALGFFTALEVRSPHGKPRYPNLPSMLLVLLLVLSYINIFSEGHIAVVIFHCSFAPMEVGFFVLAVKICRATACPAVKKLFLRSFIFYAVAMASWGTDIYLCSILQNLPFDLPNPQFHAYGWHIFVALASLGLIIATMKERMDFLGGQDSTTILYDPVLGVIPYLGVVASRPVVKRAVASSSSPNGKRASTPAKRRN